MNNTQPPDLLFRKEDHQHTAQTVKHSHSIRYLGITVTDKATIRSHLRAKLISTRQSFNTLQRLWSHSNIENQFKLKIYKGVFPQMALYAAHHDWHHKTTTDQVDAWHCKLLRRVMKYKTTYIDRSKPNSWVYKQTKSAPLSNTIHQRQTRYYAHLTRHPEDIAHQVTFGPGLLIRKLNSTRRPGGPRHHWTPKVESLLTQLVTSSGKPAANRQQLHSICQSSKFILAATVTAVPVASEARHDGAVREGGMS